MIVVRRSRACFWLLEDLFPIGANARWPQNWPPVVYTIYVSIATATRSYALPTAYSLQRQLLMINSVTSSFLEKPTEYGRAAEKSRMLRELSRGLQGVANKWGKYQ